MVHNECERVADSTQPNIDLYYDEGVNNAYAQAREGLRQLQDICNAREHAQQLIFLRGTKNYANIVIMNDQLIMNQALLEEKLKVFEAIIKSKSKLLESCQVFYVEDNLAHVRATTKEKRAQMSNDVLHSQVTTLIDTKNVLKEALTRARQELEANKQTLFLVERNEIKLKEIQATANQSLED